MAAAAIARREGVRLTQALVIGLVVQLVATGIVVPGLADEGDGLPETFRVREPRPGDRAVYDGSGDAEDLRAVVATWGNVSWVAAPDGRWIEARMLRLTLLGPAREGPRGEGLGIEDHRSLSHVVHVDVALEASTWDPVAWTRTVVEVKGPDWAGTHEEKVYRTDRVLDQTTSYIRPTVPFGFATELHRRSVPTDETVTVQTARPTSKAVHLEAAKLERVGDGDAIRYGAAEDGTAAWYASDVPFPLRLEASVADVLPGNASDRRIRWTISGFRPAPARSPAPDPRPAPLGDVDQATRTPWGPTAGSFESAFPVEQAYDAMMDEDGSESASSFLEDHPGAYIAETELSRREAAFDQGSAWVWRFYLTDGRDGLERFVVRRDDRQPTPLLDDGTHVKDRDEMEGSYSVPADHHPAPDRVPDRLPRLDDVATRYARLVDDPAADRWRFRTACPTADCRDVRTVLGVGGGGPTSAGEERWARSRTGTVRNASASLVVDGSGRTIHLTRRERTPQDGHTASLQGPDGPPAPAPTAPWRSSWTPSAEQAARAGLLAALAAGLYYLWPKVKALGGALYSRIGDDEVLDHPTRREILDMVRDDPGIHFSKLKRRLDIGRGILEHHLDKLVEADVLVEANGSGYRCYVEQGAVDRGVIEVVGRLRAATARKLLTAAEEAPERSLRDLAEQVDIAESTASYHLRSLVEAGLLEKERVGGRLAIRPTDLGRRALDGLGLG